MNYSVNDIAAILRPDLKLSTSNTATIGELLIDSRSLLEPEKAIFFAIRTPRDNGHRFIPELYHKGVRTFVVEEGFADASLYPQATFIPVANPAEALRQLGATHRSRFNIPVIGITGSRGKTMVKEWLYQMLSPDRSVARSPRSFNSSVGVPLSLWQLDEGSELALIEAGISQKGDMAPLEAMIKPDIVVLTDIGDPHSEGFASSDEKIAEKLLLAREASTLIYPASDPSITRAVNKAVASGALPAAIRLIDSSATGIASLCPAMQQLESDWQRSNMATCAATMRVLGYDDDVIALRASTLHPISTRLKVSEGVNHCLVVADDYTCDLHSLLPALDFIARRATADRTLTLVLSDMSHETLPADATYAATARLCRLRNVRRVIGVGREIARHAQLFPEGSRFFADAADSLNTLTPTDLDHERVIVKGTPQSGLASLVHMLEARTHETVLEVNLDALVSNFNFYRSRLRPETGIVAMVKASGYGAGSYELAKTLQSRGAAYLAVAVLDEGIDLRRAGITMPIMVLNPKVLNYRQLFANRLEPEIYGFDILDEIIAEARKAGITDYPVHIKLDTGMHRLGFLEADLPQLIERLKGQNNVRVCSVFSHLATADCFDMDDYTLMQLDTFTRCSQRIVDAFPHRVLRHILNTAGIIRFPQFQFDMVRLGIGLYGVPVLNDGSEAPLRQVSTLRTPIIAIKQWEAGTTIGYGRRGKLDRTSLIATIPIGYADGINRHMGCGRVSFLVNGVKCPTVGSICMDICMIDVTDVPNVAVGDSVEIFGEANPAANLSTPLGTIPYEILTAVSPRVPRLYFSE